MPEPPVAVIVIVPSSTPHSVGCVSSIEVIDGADAELIITGLFAQAVKHEPSVFLTKILYVPSPRPLKVLDACQLIPPSIENSMLPPNVAAIEICPSATPQLVGALDTTLSIVGCVLSIKISFGAACSQVPSAFLTRIWNVPPESPVKVLDNCQLKPPLIEYSRTLADAELAVISIEPSLTPQSLGSVDVT